jgi:Coenzyme PQQ synthesis protein D (PqqD)
MCQDTWPERGIEMADLYQQTSEIELEQMGGETVLLNPATSQFCLLNRSAAVVWSTLKEPKSLDSVASALCGSFDGVSEAEASKDAENVIAQLRKNGFIVRID